MVLDADELTDEVINRIDSWNGHGYDIPKKVAGNELVPIDEQIEGLN